MHTAVRPAGRGAMLTDRGASIHAPLGQNLVRILLREFGIKFRVGTGGA
jgi:hypothetical protein